MPTVPPRGLADEEFALAFEGAEITHRLLMIADDPRRLLATWLSEAPAAELSEFHMARTDGAFVCRIGFGGLGAAEARRVADLLVARGVARNVAVEHRVDRIRSPGMLAP